MEYKYNQRAGVLNEATPPRGVPIVAAKARLKAPVFAQSLMASQEITDEETAEDYASAHSTGVGLAIPAANAPVHAQTVERRAAHVPTAPPPVPRTGIDPVRSRGGRGMFFYVVEEGQRVRVIEKDGRVSIVAGPQRIWSVGRRVEPMVHYVAHPGEFLIVRFRDGRQQHQAGPAEVWFDARIHAEIKKEDALQIASKEAVVVYARDSEKKVVSRRIVQGPANFVPEPGEWLHTFSWHGSKGGHQGYTKVPNALVFQKLWFLPDQMYHDVPNVRTADDAVLTIRLMLFFELVDVEVMLDTTHDPIGDFVNAATSDIVEFTARHDLDSFKRHTEKLNELDTYRQLVARAKQCGYRINKVVYRGYAAADNIQRMHDEAIESRTRLQLERATQQQAQDLEDFKLEREHARATRQRREHDAQTEHEINQRARRQEAALREHTAEREFERTQLLKDAEQNGSLTRAKNDAVRLHLAALQSLGVDLTAYLTQERADQVIELRGGAESRPHVHLRAERD